VSCRGLNLVLHDRRDIDRVIRGDRVIVVGNRYPVGLQAFVKQVFVFAIVTFAWIFFRAATLGDAWLIVTRIFTSGLANPLCPLLAIVLIVAVWCYQYVFDSRLRRALEFRVVRMGLVVLMLAYLALFAPSGEQPFIYMQF